MSRFVTLGEMLLRLKSPAHERLLQSPLLEASFGGAEANVAVSLARFGLDAAFVTALPENPIAEAGLAELRRSGVDVSGSVRRGRRVGIYFLEAGSDQRPSEVVYDREGSAIAETEAAAFDWDTIFTGAGWFHVSGITPALSETSADLALEACRQARRHGLTVSCDLNHRTKLWNYGRRAPEVMRELVGLADVAIGGQGDARLSLDIDAGVDVAATGLETEPFEILTASILDEFPNLSTIAITLRDTKSANANSWSACLRQGESFLCAPRYEITEIVDRIGTGDAFAAGLIYGLNRYTDPGDALAFATAAGCLKHTISGDFNRVGVAEVERLMAGGDAGRVQR